VEDEVITQRYLRDIFSQYDVEVTGCFTNAKDTVEGLKNIACDMLLMDINIEGATDGIQLARQILQTYDLPIIFITAHNDDETLDEILELAPYGFITKPFSSKEVVINVKIAYKRYLTHIKVSSSISTDELDLRDVVINEKYTYSPKMCELYDTEKSIKFNQKQYLLIALLAKNINHTVSYNILVSEIWGGDKIADSALRTLVYSVRKLVPDLPIISYSKMGYMLSTKGVKKDD